MNNNDILSVQQTFGIIGKNPLLLRALNAAVQAAPFDVNVLITGENGVGKEVFHKIIHNNSPRKFKKCITVNCGGLPDGTIDSELFGHVKGAFTGAMNDRKGYFEEADGSTIFLDEVGELPLPTQARLLRILETGEYYRVGSSEIRKTDVRVIAATNVDLLKAIAKGKFREDLYYRLSTITIDVPSLRERQEDIFLLFRKFASDIANKYKMPPISLSVDAQRKLLAYQWPGNVRQLLHIVEEMSIVEEERAISADTLQHYLPVFDERISIADENHGDAFKPGEKELLYKVIFDMRKELDDVRQSIGLQTNHASTQNVQTKALAAGGAFYEANGAYNGHEGYNDGHDAYNNGHGAYNGHAAYESGVSAYNGHSALSNASAVNYNNNTSAVTPLQNQGNSSNITAAHSLNSQLTLPNNSFPTAGNQGSAFRGAPSYDVEATEVEEVKTLDEIERDAIIASLKRHRGVKKKVADELQISERTLYRKLNDYHLDNEKY